MNITFENTSIAKEWSLISVAQFKIIIIDLEFEKTEMSNLKFYKSEIDFEPIGSLLQFTTTSHLIGPKNNIGQRMQIMI